MVWGDLCALLTDPDEVARALGRARGGAWLPQELRARQEAVRHAREQLERQQRRLLDAYLAEVVGLPEFERTRRELERRRAVLAEQQRQLEALARQRIQLSAVADGIEGFCATVRTGLSGATFARRRVLVELLLDRVVVTDAEVEIRYALPLSRDGPHPPFCQLRVDHLHLPPHPAHPHQGVHRRLFGPVSDVEGEVVGVGPPAPHQQPAPPPRASRPFHRVTEARLTPIRRAISACVSRPARSQPRRQRAALPAASVSTASAATPCPAPGRTRAITVLPTLLEAH